MSSILESSTYRFKIMIKQFFVVCAFLVSSSDASKGLKSFTATMGKGKEAGTDDNVRVELSGGLNGETCITGVISYGVFYNSWSQNDEETYYSSKQDFGTCKTFEGNKSSIGFTIQKDGTDGLDLVKMQFVIGGDTYIWEGKAGWDPDGPVETAYCTSGDCLPVDCVLSDWRNCTNDCFANCTCWISRTITHKEQNGGTCQEEENLEKMGECAGKIIGLNETCLISTKEKDDSKLTGSGPGGPIAGIVIFLLLAAVLFILYKRWKSREQDSDYQMSHMDDAPHANFVVKKNTDIKKNMKALADNKAGLKEEFKRIETHADEVINKNNTVEVANKIENKEHNRYCDQVPYDLNMVKLQTPVGDPPGTYINASTISFPMMDQTFIAVQAPKEHSFPAFWQLVLENQVQNIVMITGLVEGGKVKADQYWPDMTNQDMDLGDIKIRYESHSFPGTYYHRKLVVTDGQGRERTVNHIQTTAWLDMKAPKDSKVLLDLVYKAQELAEEKKGPMVVHCSAGVGRTGTFIGLYKLADDYHNDRVKELEMYDTVITMRKQRMKMVQKSAQYVYIAKCLHHYISAQTSEYNIA